MSHRILVAAAIVMLAAPAVTRAAQAAVTILYAFTGGTDGAEPYSSFMRW